MEDIDHGPTAPLLAELATLGRSVPVLRGLGGWAAAVAEGTGGTGPGVEYLRAVGADAAGDGPAVEAHLQAGLGVEADDPACLTLLAELIQDRGDAERSLALLRRAGRPPSPEALGELRPFLVDRQVGRNEPCPCGSGRKYKTCCWGRPIRRPLPERCRWLLAKATRHAVRMHSLGVDALRRFFATSSDEAQATALAEDMLLFTSGGLARYLASRGPFLPDDELACAQAWPGRPMRLLEVGARAAGGQIEAVDLKTGERLTVVDPSLTAPFAPGDTVLARPLPVEEQWLLGRAVVPVPPAGREAALRMVEHEVRPIHLIELLVDLQVEAIKAGGLAAAPPVLPGLGDPPRRLSLERSVSGRCRWRPARRARPGPAAAGRRSSRTRRRATRSSITSAGASEVLVERRDVVEPPGRSHQEQLVFGGAHVRMAQVPAGVHADRCRHVGQADAARLVAGGVHGRDRTGRLHEGLQPGRGVPGRGELGQHRLTGRQLVVAGRGAGRRLDTAIDPVDDLVQQGPEHRPVVDGVEPVTDPSTRAREARTAGAGTRPSAGCRPPGAPARRGARRRARGPHRPASTRWSCSSP